MPTRTIGCGWYCCWVGVAEVFGMDDGGDSWSDAGNIDCGEVVGFGSE